MDSPLNGIEAVLFDFDGVLIRSLEDHYKSWNTVLGAYGVQVGWEEFALTEGQSLYAIAREFCMNHGIDSAHSETIAKRKNDQYLATAEIKTYDGAREVLDLLFRHGIPLAVVTGAHRDRFDVSMPSDLVGYFRAAVTADEVKCTKPHPEPFLKAATLLGVEPAKCLVIENAPLGVTAAKRAGMKCFAVTTTLSRSHLKEADWIGENLQDLQRMLINESPAI